MGRADVGEGVAQPDWLGEGGGPLQCYQSPGGQERRGDDGAPADGGESSGHY